jgi:hypothetical protein
MKEAKMRVVVIGFANGLFLFVSEMLASILIGARPEFGDDKATIRFVLHMVFLAVIYLVLLKNGINRQQTDSPYN